MKTLVRSICSLINPREPSVSSRAFSEVSTMSPLAVHLHRSIYFLLICSSFHQLASLSLRTRGKCAFSKKLNALEMLSPPNPVNLHSTLNPASDFQHLACLYKYKNLTLLLLYKDTYNFKTWKWRHHFLQKQPVLIQNATCTSTLTKVNNNKSHHHQHSNPFATFNAQTMLWRVG